MSIVLSSIPSEELMKLRFVLKLWIVTNDPSISYLRWNRDRTTLIADLYELTQMFETGTSNIFMCKTIENFLWLMHKHAFEKCSPDVLQESEREKIKRECMLFRHPQFIGSNYEMFDAWLTYPAVRLHEENELNANCTLPPQMQFMMRENIEEFSEVRMYVMSQMMYLQSMLRAPMREQGTVSVEIPQQNVDYQAVDVPDYFKTKEIEGNFGPVSVSELKQCLGDLLPIPDNDLAYEESGNANDTLEEVEVIADDEMSENNDVSYVVHEAAPIQTETPANVQFHDLREMYENADLWTNHDGNVVECHEVYKLGEDQAQEFKAESEDESDGNDVNHDVNQPKMQPFENLPKYLTDSVQACIPAVDSD